MVTLNDDDFESDLNLTVTAIRYVLLHQAVAHAAKRSGNESLAAHRELLTLASFGFRRLRAHKVSVALLAWEVVIVLGPEAVT